MVLHQLRIVVPCVVAPDDTDSLILANAAARLLSVPLVTMPSDGSDAQGLLVVYELAGQPPEVIRRLGAHRPDQTLWVHSAGWTREEPRSDIPHNGTSHCEHGLRPCEFRCSAQRYGGLGTGAFAASTAQSGALAVNPSSGCPVSIVAFAHKSCDKKPLKTVSPSRL